MQAALRLQAVQHRFEHGPLWPKTLSVDFEAPAAWVILGPNGIGKSTLLSVVAGLLKPTEGRVSFYLAGKICSSEAWRSHLSWVSPHLFPPAELTVQDLLWTYQQRKGIPEDPRAFLTELHLWERRQAPLYRLSSGQRQRLLLALVLQVSAPALLLDEPTAFLDETWKAFFHARFLEHIAQNQSLILCATNDPEEAALFPEKLYLGTYAA